MLVLMACDRHRYLLFFTLLVAGLACNLASAQINRSIGIVEGDSLSSIYIFRNDRFDAASCVKLEVNDLTIECLKKRDFVEFRVKPGKVRVAATTKNLLFTRPPIEVVIDADEGGKAYFHFTKEIIHGAGSLAMNEQGFPEQARGKINDEN